MISQIEMVIKSLLSAGGVVGILYLVLWVKHIFDQKRRNNLNELDLSFKKISLDNANKPLDQLVNESNESHGLRKDDVVKPTGSGDKV